MPRHFTHYWNNDTWEREKRWRESDPDRYPLNHAGSNVFAERGVGQGNLVYPVTVIGGELYLPDRMRIDKVEASRKLALNMTGW